MPSSTVAKVIGGIGSGVTAALISHVFNTAKVKIQNEITTGYLHQHFFASTWQSLQQECAKSGAWSAAKTVSRDIPKDASCGLGPRLGVVTLFITTVKLSSPAFKQALEWAAK